MSKCFQHERVFPSVVQHFVILPYCMLLEGSVGQLQTQSELVEVKINNPITTPVPDASRRWRRVVQHISWSPVIVELTWR